MCTRGDHALDEFRDYRPDLVLLDLMLPGKDGIDVCKEIRAESGVPIVMLTAKGDTVDVVVGLESGADDYVVKPFKPKELVARIRARLRRFDDRRPRSRWRSATSSSTSPATSVTPRRRPDQPDPAGVRPAGLPGPQAVAGVHPRGPARAGLGLPARRRHPAGQRARAAAALQGRARPGEPRDRGDRARRRLQGRARREHARGRSAPSPPAQASRRGARAAGLTLLAALDPGARRRQHAWCSPRSSVSVVGWFLLAADRATACSTTG